MRWRELRRCPSCGRKTYIVVTPDGLIPCKDCARWFSEARDVPKRIPDTEGDDG